MSDPSIIRQQHWQQVYTVKDETAVSWFQESPQISLALIAASGLTRDAGIIDVGGGASRLVDALLAAGHSDLTVLDIAEAALAKTRQRLGASAAAVAWIAADITAWQPQRHYALWHDRAVFHFLTAAEDRAAYKRALQAALLPGGQAIIASFAPDGPERCSGLPVMRYAPESLVLELGAGFRLEETRSEPHKTPAGGQQAFQYSRFRRL